MNSRMVEQLLRLGACMPVALVGSLCLALFGCRSREAAANVNGPVRAEMKVGDFRPVTGTGFLIASAYTKNEAGVLDRIGSGSGGYGKEAGPVHNLLFASLDDLSGRWLLSHNRFLIWDTEELPPAENNRGVGVYKMTTPEQRVARWIYLELIKSDTNKNGKWDYEDRRAIAIADSSGANCVEVITEIDEILQRSMNTEDKLTVVYRSNSKLFIANIDLAQRQVTTKDLPEIP